jgi:hypothetical protein
MHAMRHREWFLAAFAAFAFGHAGARFIPRKATIIEQAAASKFTVS